MSRYIDDELLQLIVARWRLCDGIDAATDPIHNYTAAKARSELLLELLQTFYDDVKFDRVADLAAYGELESLAEVLTAAVKHNSLMTAKLRAERSS